MISAIVGEIIGFAVGNVDHTRLLTPESLHSVSVGQKIEADGSPQCWRLRRHFIQPAGSFCCGGRRDREACVYWKLTALRVENIRKDIPGTEGQHTILELLHSI
jgi:hypothetical protein